MTHDDWIKTLAPLDAWNERLILATFALVGIPESYFDVGSGTGAMVNVARRLGVAAFGVDQLPRPDDWLYQHDLCKPFELGRQFPLVTSLEVAEHIPHEADSEFCDTIAKHVAPGGYLIFSAAHPGQGGEEHVNNRPAQDWRRMFYERGLLYESELTCRLVALWLMIPHPLFWLMSNVQIFKR